MSYKATTLSSFGLALLAIEVDGPSAPPGGTTTPPLVDALGVRIVDADAKGVDDLGVEEGASPKDEHHVQEGESEGRGRRDRPGESKGRVDTSGRLCHQRVRRSQHESVAVVDAGVSVVGNFQFSSSVT